MENWKAFCDALEECNNTEFYGETYPELRAKFQTQSYEEVITDEVYKVLESGQDPTECLNEFLRTVLGSASRYSHEMGEVMTEVIQMFLDKGAKFPYEKLFDRRYPEEDYYEDEIADYPIRGMIIDYLKPDCAKNYADWSKIEATYWEDIPEDVKCDEFRFRYLKDCSEYLKTL